MRRCVLGLALLMFVVACDQHTVNPPLETYDESKGYRFKNLSNSKNSDSLFVILTFSGGGTRAAALSYGVLRKLRDTTIVWEGEKRRLLDEVDVISSVSGGSFTAAYYALHRDGLFEDFETEMLHRDVEGDLIALLFSPMTWVKLASPTYSRIDLAADYYDEHIFKRMTYDDLMKQGERPFLIVNATDMSLGARFWFAQSHFDLLCSDLTQVRIARSVAASSAFPAAFAPMTLRNYPKERCGYRKPSWVEPALKDFSLQPGMYRNARDSESYLDAEKRPYIHLIDGGVADNIGLRGPLHSITSRNSPWSVERMITRRAIEKLVVVIVDAKTSPSTDWDREERAPGISDVLEAVATVPMDNYSFDTVEQLKEAFSARKKADKASRACKGFVETHCAATPPSGPPRVETYRIHVAFEALKNPEELTYFMRLPTSLSLKPEAVDRLISVAGRLLDESSTFQELRRDLQ